MRYKTQGNISIDGKEYQQNERGIVELPDGVAFDYVAHSAEIAVDEEEPADAQEAAVEPSSDAPKKRGRKPKEVQV